MKNIYYINKYIIENNLEFLENLGLFLINDIKNSGYSIDILKKKIKSIEVTRYIIESIYKHEEFLRYIGIDISKILNILEIFKKENILLNEKFRINIYDLYDIEKNTSKIGYILFGEPGSGKSTLTLFFPHSTPIYSVDSNRLSFAYNKIGYINDYKKAFDYCENNKEEFFKYNMKNFYYCIESHPYKGNIIIDNTNCFKRARKNIIKKLIKNDYTLIGVYCISDKNKLIENNKNRIIQNKNISEEILDQFIYYKEPMFEDEIEYYINSEELNVNI